MNLNDLDRLPRSESYTPDFRSAGVPQSSPGSFAQSLTSHGLAKNRLDICRVLITLLSGAVKFPIGTILKAGHVDGRGRCRRASLVR